MSFVFLEILVKSHVGGELGYAGKEHEANSTSSETGVNPFIRNKFQGLFQDSD